MPKGHYTKTTAGWKCSNCGKTTSRYYHECPFCGQEKDGYPADIPKERR